MLSAFHYITRRWDFTKCKLQDIQVILSPSFPHISTPLGLLLATLLPQPLTQSSSLPLLKRFDSKKWFGTSCSCDSQGTLSPRIYQGPETLGNPLLLYWRISQQEAVHSGFFSNLGKKVFNAYWNYRAIFVIQSMFRRNLHHSLVFLFLH